ncbi:MAG: aldose 1-epimerase family protein [Bacteroidota bacterium]
MKKTLENDYLKINVKRHGAELCNIIKKDTNTEYLWQADPDIWGRHAPILFPIVGKLKADKMTVNGEVYSMKQHGLARNMDFELVESDKSSLTFELNSSTETLKHYPFAFRLRVKYTLQAQQLLTTYQVYNPSDVSLIFSIGGHPAFRCPLHADEKRSDYQLIFNQKETAVTQRLDEGIRNGKTELILEDSAILPLKDDLFDQDALVFANLNSNQVSLCQGTQKQLTFHFNNFPYLGIWSKNRTAPFVCIEPWFGIADHQNHRPDFVQKEGIIQLAAQDNFACTYTVEIH